MPADSFMKSLFGGVIAEGSIFPFPELKRSEADELHAIVDGFRKFAASNVDSADFDQRGEIGPAVLTGLKELGLFGLRVPKTFGGRGLSLSATTVVPRAWTEHPLRVGDDAGGL